MMVLAITGFIFNSCGSDDDDIYIFLRPQDRTCGLFYISCEQSTAFTTQSNRNFSIIRLFRT